MTDTNEAFPLLGAVRAGHGALGSKAAALNDLSAQGFRVPPGFVVSADDCDRPGRILAAA